MDFVSGKLINHISISRNHLVLMAGHSPADYPLVDISKQAKALGLTVPIALLGRADVIE